MLIDSEKNEYLSLKYLVINQLKLITNEFITITQVYGN